MTLDSLSLALGQLFLNLKAQTVANKLAKLAYEIQKQSSESAPQSLIVYFVTAPLIQKSPKKA